MTRSASSPEQTVPFEDTNQPAETFLKRIADPLPTEIAKGNAETRAWLAVLGGAGAFVKFVPTSLYASRTTKEIAIAGGQLHPAIVSLRRVIRCADGMLLIYDRVDGETLTGPEARSRFYALPVEEKRAALRTLFDALAAVCDAGWVLVDVYEGNVMYDYATRLLHVFDFDLCEPGDGFLLAMERNYGSSRLMAPEEFEKGAWIDQRTNVFNLGHIATLALKDEPLPPGLATVLARATNPERTHRHATVRAFTSAFATSA
jgi:serine/threonine-protein kinase